MLRQPARWLALAGLAVACVVAAVTVPLYALGSHAPPAVEATALDAADSPTAEAAAAARNLRAGSYAYTMYVNRSDGDRTYTTAYEHVVVDNPARVYRAAVRNPPRAVNWSREPVAYYGNGPAGYRYTPSYAGGLWVTEEERGSWTADDGLRFHHRRNALTRPGRIAGANATVVTANESTLVVRVTDPEVAADVGHPFVVEDAENATATLTLHVDRDAGVLDRAVFRYADERGVSVTTTYRVRRYGAVEVRRPPGTLPPDVRQVLHQFDLGVRALASLLDGGAGA